MVISFAISVRLPVLVPEFWRPPSPAPLAARAFSSPSFRSKVDRLFLSVQQLVTRVGVGYVVRDFRNRLDFHGSFTRVRFICVGLLRLVHFTPRRFVRRVKLRSVRFAKRACRANRVGSTVIHPLWWFRRVVRHVRMRVLVPTRLHRHRRLHVVHWERHAPPGGGAWKVAPRTSPPDIAEPALWLEIPTQTGWGSRVQPLTAVAMTPSFPQQKERMRLCDVQVMEHHVGLLHAPRRLPFLVNDNSFWHFTDKS